LLGTSGKDAERHRQPPVHRSEISKMRQKTHCHRQPVVAGFGSRAKDSKAAKWANGTTVLKNPKGISAFSPVLVRSTYAG